MNTSIAPPSPPPAAFPTAAELAILTRVIHNVARAGRLSREDGEDFAQCVQLKFLERGYDAFRRFEGRSTLKTFLTVVVRRMLLDWQDHAYGKWRPTVTAVRLGPHAVQLEKLINRDAYSPAEAILHVSASADAPGVPELRRLADSVPRRPHRRTVSIDSAPSPRVDFSDPVADRDRLLEQARINRRLADALARLSEADRALLDLRYRENLSVPAIARQLKIDVKALYRHFNRVLRMLRACLVQQGVAGSANLGVH